MLECTFVNHDCGPKDGIHGINMIGHDWIRIISRLTRDLIEKLLLTAVVKEKGHHLPWNKRSSRLIDRYACMLPLLSEVVILSNDMHAEIHQNKGRINEVPATIIHQNGRH